MSTWQRLLGLLRGELGVIPALEGEGMEGYRMAAERSGEELWLETLIADVAENRRLDVLASETFWKRIDGLWSAGHERLAIEWLSKFIAAEAVPSTAAVELRARLVEFYERRGELALAVPHLTQLVDDERYATRAHYLLAEHYRRRGDEAGAMRHYESVLARDVDYLNARGRLEWLRAARGRVGASADGVTLVSAGAHAPPGGARYQLLREIGRGATGVVYMARDIELERDVAVKLLHPYLAAAHRAAACRRFFAEARVAASLRHPNIVAVLDIDEDARRIVMELAAGGTLRTVLRQRGRRTLRRSLERHAQILSALAAAHRHGVVHRDLKPANLMFRRDADAAGVEIALGDFGVAHLPNAEGATGAAAARERQAAEAVGTLAYMSPEQRRGDAVDYRSDLYAAAVVLYEMLTGRPPWPRDILWAGTRRRGDFRLREEIVAGVDPALVAALQDHLDALGDPEAAGRMETQEALRHARRLRDFAIATAS